MHVLGAPPWALLTAIALAPFAHAAAEAVAASLGGRLRRRGEQGRAADRRAAARRRKGGQRDADADADAGDEGSAPRKRLRARDKKERYGATGTAPAAGRRSHCPPEHGAAFNSTGDAAECEPPLAAPWAEPEDMYGPGYRAGGASKMPPPSPPRQPRSSGSGSAYHDYNMLLMGSDELRRHQQRAREREREARSRDPPAQQTTSSDRHRVQRSVASADAHPAREEAPRSMQASTSASLRARGRAMDDGVATREDAEFEAQPISPTAIAADGFTPHSTVRDASNGAGSESSVSTDEELRLSAYVSGLEHDMAQLRLRCSTLERQVQLQSKRFAEREGEFEAQATLLAGQLEAAESALRKIIQCPSEYLYSGSSAPPSEAGYSSPCEDVDGPGPPPRHDERAKRRDHHVADAHGECAQRGPSNAVVPPTSRLSGGGLVHEPISDEELAAEAACLAMHIEEEANAAIDATSSPADEHFDRPPKRADGRQVLAEQLPPNWRYDITREDAKDIAEPTRTRAARGGAH